MLFSNGVNILLLCPRLYLLGYAYLYTCIIERLFYLQILSLSLYIYMYTYVNRDELE